MGQNEAKLLCDVAFAPKIYNKGMANNNNTPTIKQKMFAKAFVEGILKENKPNASKAALETYNVKPANAPNLGYQLMEKEPVQIEIKSLLDKAGITLDYLSDSSKDAIDYNLKGGKPSQAVGADLLKFMFKLHNAVPEKRTRTIKEERRVILSHDYQTLKNELKLTQTKTQELLQDLE